MNSDLVTVIDTGEVGCLRQRDIYSSIFREVVFFSDAAQVDYFGARPKEFKLIASGKSLCEAQFVFFGGRPKHFNFFSHSTKEEIFIQAEWDSIISLYIHQMRDRVVNYSLLGVSRSYIQGATAKRRVANFLGIDLTPVRIVSAEEDFSINLEQHATFTVFVSHCDFCLPSGAALDSPELEEFAKKVKCLIWEQKLRYLILDINISDNISLSKVSLEFPSSFAVDIASKLLARSLGRE